MNNKGDKAPVRVAILGLGMGTFHLEVLRKNPQAQVTMLCDLREDHARNLAERTGVPEYCTDYHKVAANPNIDAVVVALPVFLHAPVTIEMIEAGKHVLVEKPMAARASDAEAMLAAARKKGLVLTINHNQRFGPDVHFLTNYMAEGKLGRIHFARCIWTRPANALPGTDRNWFNEKDKGGGVLYDLGTHLLDKVLALLGFPEPVEFAASRFTVLGKRQEGNTGFKFDADDLTVGMIRFANGLTIQLEVGFASHIERELLYYELYGEKGGVSTRDGFKIFTTEQDIPVCIQATHGLPIPPIATVPDDFVDAILNKRVPAITPESGCKVVRILDGLARAAETGWGAFRHDWDRVPNTQRQGEG